MTDATSTSRYLSYVTPTGIAKAAEAAERARRQAAAAAAIDLESIPDDHARYRTTVDGPWLRRIADRVVADRRAAMLTDDMRDAMVAALHADVAAANPADEMAILARHGFGAECDSIEIIFALSRGRGIRDYIAPAVVAMPRRHVARPPVYIAPVVRDADARPSHRTARPLPDPALPWFDTLYALHQERVPKIMAVTGWPEKAKARTGKWPRWGEIFDRFEIVGEWVADQRDPARAVPDRGGDCRTCDAAPSRPGEPA